MTSSNRPTGRLRTQVALTFGVSEHRVRSAEELLRRDPQLAADVLSKKVKLGKALAKVRRDEQLRLIATTKPPEGSFRTLVVDPPWRFSDAGIRGAAAGEYSVMDVADIEKVSVASVAAERSHLYLWAPSLFLCEGKRLLEGWGFGFVTSLVWDKGRLGLGHYFRNSHETVLFGVKGKLPTKVRDAPTVFHGRVRRHSQKPEEFFRLVERLSHPPYVELFARSQRPGWTCWGAEAGTPVVEGRGRRAPTKGATPIHKSGTLIKRKGPGGA